MKSDRGISFCASQGLLKCCSFSTSSFSFVRDLYDSKTSLKCVPKYGIEEIIAQIVRKEHTCASQSELCFQLICIFRRDFYRYFTGIQKIR